MDEIYKLGQIYKLKPNQRSSSKPNFFLKYTFHLWLKNMGLRRCGSELKYNVCYLHLICDGKVLVYLIGYLSILFLGEKALKCIV